LINRDLPLIIHEEHLATVKLYSQNRFIKPANYKLSMQEKIANLEIKIFYDSAITKKKKKSRELSKAQCEERVQQVYTDGNPQPDEGQQKR
jgi:hypothetical protein